MDKNVGNIETQKTRKRAARRKNGTKRSDEASANSEALVASSKTKEGDLALTAAASRQNAQMNEPSTLDQEPLKDSENVNAKVAKKTRKRAARKKSGTKRSGKASADSGALVPVSETKGSDLALIAAASRQIATMSEPRKLDQEYLKDSRIIFPEMQNRKVANAFREIRTKLLRRSQGQNPVTMVTSVSARGGGSFIALNLAAAFAFDDSKTSLLVDCNLRDPSQHNRIGIEPEYGLTDYLENPELDTELIIYPSGIHRLRIIPVGRRRENVVEHFTSLRMRNLISDIQGRYPDRYIILDAPPVGESVDARILADLCDLVVIVVDYGKVTESQVMSAVDAVGKEKLAGVILNNDPGYVLPVTLEQFLPRLTN
jgi:protein-tyrosine kinase